eukprot:4988172-Prymnesium_polylepis.1
MLRETDGTWDNGYTARVDSGSCGPQATWDRASQGVPRLATVLAPGQSRLAPRDAAHDRSASPGVNYVTLYGKRTV